MIINIKQADRACDKIIQTLEKGGIVAIPTDTVYGLAVDGTNKSAVQNLLALKKRKNRPFTFFIPKVKIDNYAVITKKQIIEHLIPGPLTIILEKRCNVSLPLIDNKIGIRVPKTDFVIELLNRFDKPLAVTSANLTGYPPIISAYEIVEKFPEVEIVVDAGILSPRVSTIVDLTTTPPLIKRKGALPILKLEKIYGDSLLMDKDLKFNVLFVCTGNTCRSPMAMGLLETLIEPRFAQIDSAGTAAISGLPPAQFAIDIVKEFGGSIENYQTKYLSCELIEWADLILVMEQKHYNAVLELLPRSKAKLFFLRAYKKNGEEREVPDPVGRGRSAYERVAKIMLPSLKKVAQDIKNRFRQI